jgi:hypothetical protein
VSTAYLAAGGLTYINFAIRAIEGAVDTDVFNVYVERALRPTVRRGDILTLDNLGAHHAGLLEALRRSHLH